MNAFRILVADDHEVVRRGICALLTAHPGWEVCGEASDGREAVEKAAALKPDVVVLDIGMPGLNGLNAAQQILRTDPKTKILILTMHDSTQVVQEVLQAGARGYLLKSDAGKDLATAVEALQRDRMFFTSKVADLVLQNFRRDKPISEPMVKDTLTLREREVVQLLAEGKSTKEAAVVLGVSVKTAETHRSNIMRKLEIHSVSELVLYAVRNNIVHVARL